MTSHSINLCREIRKISIHLGYKNTSSGDMRHTVFTQGIKVFGQTGHD